MTTRSIMEVIAAFNTILKWSNEITKSHIARRNGKSWSMYQQLMHTVEECGEVNQHLRFNRSNDLVLQELTDIVFSAFTNFNIYNNFTSEELNNALSTTMMKILERTTDTSYVVEQND